MYAWEYRILFYKNLKAMQENGHVVFFMFSQILMVKQCLCYLFCVFSNVDNMEMFMLFILNIFKCI